jgi:hypothetical protein
MLLVRVTCAAVFLLACSVPAISANLIRNGSFEKPVVADGQLQRFHTGDKFSGWTVVGASGAVDVINKDFMFQGQNFPPKKGNQLLDLTGDSDTATGVQQNVATNAGATYEVSFFLGSPYDTTGQLGTSSTVHVLVDGNEAGSFTSPGKRGSNMHWRKFSTQFVAQKSSTAIAFINGDPQNDTANGLDGVSVTLVAAP